MENSEARKWMGKAESDLKHAKHSVDCGDFDWVEIASQQAAEKALKAVCIQQGIGLIKVHDVALLARKVNAPLEILEKCGLLNPFYTASRYPDAEELMDEKLKLNAAMDALSAAGRIVTWCKKQII